MVDPSTMSNADLAANVKLIRGDLDATKGFKEEYQNGRLQAVADGHDPEFYRSRVIREHQERRDRLTRTCERYEAEIAKRQAEGAWI